jgi:prolyl oligopeptidase
VTEFGTVKNAEQFKAVYAYSPYHHLVDGTKYPAILMMTGANDGRVAPHHSSKMTARLLAANKSENPILLRTSSSASHGIGTALSERIKQSVDIYAFLFAQLGMSSKPGD